MNFNFFLTLICLQQHGHYVGRLAHSSYPLVFVCRVFIAVVKTALTEIVWHLIRVSPLPSDSMPLGCVLLLDWLSEWPICMSVHGVVGQWGEVRADSASAVATGQQSFCSRRKPGREVGTERENGAGSESETIDLIMHAHFPIHGGECERGRGVGRQPMTFHRTELLSGRTLMRWHSAAGAQPKQSINSTQVVKRRRDWEGADGEKM